MLHAVLPADAQCTLEISHDHRYHRSLSNDRFHAPDRIGNEQTSVLQYMYTSHSTLTKSVTLSVALTKWVLLFIEQRWKSVDGIAGKSYYLIKMLDLYAVNLSLMTMLSFSKTVHRRILRSTQSNCYTARLSTSFFVNYGPVTAGDSPEPSSTCLV